MEDEIGGAGSWTIDPTNPNRAIYQDEDGNTYEAFKDEPTAAPAVAPATPQAPAPAQPEAPAPQAPRGMFERLSDNYASAANDPASFSGLVARTWYDWNDAGKDELRKKFPNVSDDQLEAFSDTLIGRAQAALSEELANRRPDDPVWGDDATAGEIAKVILTEPDKWIPALAGQILGGASPTDAIPFGKFGDGVVAVLKRMGLAAGIGGGENAALQGAAIADEAQEDFSLRNVLESAALSAGFQSLAEVPAFTRSLFEKKGADTTPGATPGPYDPKARFDKTVAVGPQVSQMINDGATLDEVSAFLGEQGLQVSDFQNVEKAIGAVQQGKTSAYVNPKGDVNTVAKAAPSSNKIRPNTRAIKVNDAVNHVNEITKDWTNAPEFQVIDDIANLADEGVRDSIDPDAIGVLLPDGKVLINLKNVDGPETLSAVTFHEALGHYGLAQKFREDLDVTLEDIYLKSPEFAQQVDAWAALNPDYYDPSTPNLLARQAEEVLAEMSESGAITPGVMDRIKNYLKDLGRQMGLDLKYSDREIKTILGMAHNAVRNGAPTAVDNGFRYDKMSPEFSRAFIEYSLGRNVKPSKLFDDIETGADPQARADIETRAEQLRPKTPKSGLFNEVRRLDDGTMFLEYNASDGSRLPIKMAIEADGTAEIAVDQFSTQSNRLGPAEMRKAMLALAEDYPEIKKFAGFRRSGAGAGRVQEIDVGSRKVAESVNRYMKKRQPDEKIGSVRLDKIETVNDIDELIYELAAVTPDKKTVSIEQTEADAIARGLTPSRIAKSKGLGEAGALTSRIRAANIALAQQFENVAALEKDLEVNGYSEKSHEKMLGELAKLKAIHARVNTDNSELGRALNILKQVSRSKAAGAALKDIDHKILADPEQFMKFMKLLREQIATGNTNGAIKLSSDVFKPKLEDAIFRVYYNMLLSSPATHTANFAGTGGNFLYDLLENTGAAIIGQGKRFSNADRIRGREVAYRVWGALQGLRAGTTWSAARESLNTGLVGGKTTEKTGASNVYTGDNKAVQAVSGVLEAPTRALAGTDEWWRNVLQVSNLYGLAVRNAGNKGLKGKAFWEEVDNLINNPTKEMIDATNDYTKVLQFLDKPSGIARWMDSARNPKVGEGPAKRLGRGIIRLAVPFVNTPDALIRTAIRRSPLAYERENINGWQKGGAERDKVLARLLMGSMLSFWVAAQTGEYITGNGPSDYKKRAAWLKTHQPNSIKVNGKWRSIQGLEPVSTIILAPSTIVERVKAGEITLDKADIGTSVASAVHGIASLLSENAYLEGFTDLIDIGIGDKNKAANAFENFVAATAAAVTVPAIVRKYSQTQDNAVRDTTGDGSLEDRIYGRIVSGIPGMSQQLPQKYDTAGQPMTREFGGPDMLSRSLTMEPTDDPAIQEMGRLEDLTKKVVVGAPTKHGIKVDGVQRTLTAEEYQEYQYLSGYWITEVLRQEMATPEYQAMTDEEKIDMLTSRNGIVASMRKAARDYLFDPEDEEEETE